MCEQLAAINSNLNGLNERNDHLEKRLDDRIDHLENVSTIASTDSKSACGSHGATRNCCSTW
jgi:hypothetical protein